MGSFVVVVVLVLVAVVGVEVVSTSVVVMGCGGSEIQEGNNEIWKNPW